jgi:uncharacterized protein
MKILSVSDEEVGLVYSSQIASRFRGADIAISCGDLPCNYLDYMVSMLNIPLYFVHGNHVREQDESGPAGGTDLHARVVRDRQTGLLLAGVEGSLQYNSGPHQYSQNEMWFVAYRLSLGLMINKMRFGRYLDVLVTHAPPWQIHDATDRPHQGIKAFNWLIQVYRPALVLHGHVHLYRQDAVRETQVGPTRVINTFGYRFTTLELNQPPDVHVPPRAV